MSWELLKTTLSAAGISAAVVGLILKMILQNMIDARFKSFEEQNRALILEQTRRRANIFDQQMETLKAALSIVHRARNEARAIMSAADDNALHPQDGDRMMERLRNFEYTFRQLLYEEEAILPKEIFERMHDSAYNILAMVNWYDSLRRLKRNDPAVVEKRAEQYASMKGAYEKLDEDYRYFDREIRLHLGISDDNRGAISKA